MLLYILYMVVVFPLVTHAHIYCYDKDTDNGPQNWKNLNIKCSGKNQSPINIVTRNAMERTPDNKVKVTFANSAFSVENNGHTLTLSIKTNPAELTWKGLRNKYTLQQIHVHYGCKTLVNTDAKRGTEHWIDGKAYDLEVHFVFWDSVKHKTFSHAAGDETGKGLAVVGVLYNEDVKPPNNLLEPSYSPLIKTITPLNVKVKKDSPDNLKNIVQDLLPKDIFTGSEKFYSYDGSLTTPDCNESVKWIVMSDIQSVSKNFLTALRNLPSQTNHIVGGKMCDNYRPVQTLNQRMVFFKSKQSNS